jgi:hypothetical protein
MAALALPVILLAAAGVTLAWRPALALPSFAVQTGQPCAACHVGAFGPQLTQYGRDFKLYGYVSAAPGKQAFLPLSVADQLTFTHTQKNQPPGAVFAPRFSTNDNISPLQELSLFYAGAIIPKQLGGFVEVHYEASDSTISLSNMDIRHSQEAHILGEDAVWGVTFNNSPTVQDLWNSSPGWGFPYFSSAVAPTPAANSLLDQTSHNSYGLGVYGLWNDLLYGEFDLYREPAKSTIQALGQPISNISVAEGFSPYWRAALQHSFDKDHHYLQIGTYGLVQNLRPGGDSSTGHTDHYVDTAFDANYQWYADPNDVRAPVLSTHATFIHEAEDLDASSILTGANAHNHLNTFRVDASYAIDATYTPTLQYFTKSGSADASGFWGTGADGNAVVSPDSAGWVVELAYVPWGKPDSPFGNMNGRLILQYTDYTKFNGASRHATDNNTLMLMVHLAFGLPK